MPKTLKKLNRGNSETRASYKDQRLSKFCGYGEFFSIFRPELQKLLKPIYDLPRKGRQLI